MPPPPDDALEALLDRHAPLAAVPFADDVTAFSGRSLVEVWEAAETLAGAIVPSPFWAFPWPGGIALAATIRARPELVADRTIIDVGAGGGVACFACAKSGAVRVVACDNDPWALAVTAIAARRQNLCVETMCADPTVDPTVLDPFDVVLCGDLAYSRASAVLERAALQLAASRGATVLVADAGRKYFDATGLDFIMEYSVNVVHDLEGRTRCIARVYRLPAEHQ